MARSRPRHHAHAIRGAAHALLCSVRVPIIPQSRQRLQLDLSLQKQSISSSYRCIESVCLIPAVCGDRGRVLFPNAVVAVRVALLHAQRRINIRDAEITGAEITGAEITRARQRGVRYGCGDNGSGDKGSEDNGERDTDAEIKGAKITGARYGCGDAGVS